METMNTSGIYQIKNLINGKIYIGSSISVKRRFNEHKKLLRNNKHKNNHLQLSWNKYGENNFIFSLIEKVDSQFLLTKEQYYIDLSKSYDKKIGYNICKIAGNTLGYIFSEESKIKMSKAKINLTRQNELKILSETNNHEYLNSPPKQNCNVNVNNPMFGKKHSDESKEKMCSHKLGENNPMFGKGPMLGRIPTDEHKSKIGNANSGKNNKKSKPVIQYDLEMNKIKEWDSAGIAARTLKLSVGNIWMCCNGKARTSYGFIWKYNNN
jgi:group I intron endonuclease